MFKNWSNTTKIIVSVLVIAALFIFLYQMKWLGNEKALGEKLAEEGSSTAKYSVPASRAIIVARPPIVNPDICPRGTFKNPSNPNQCCAEAILDSAQGNVPPMCSDGKTLKMTMVNGLPKYICC